MGLQAQPSHGTILYRQNGGTFEAIAELTDITPPRLFRNAIDTSSQNDDDDSYVPGIRRKDNLTAGLNFDPNGASHIALIDSWEAGETIGWKTVFPDGTEWTLSGFIDGLGTQAPVDDKIEGELSIRPTGGMIFTPA